MVSNSMWCSDHLKKSLRPFVSKQLSPPVKKSMAPWLWPMCQTSELRYKISQIIARLCAISGWFFLKDVTVCHCTELLGNYFHQKLGTTFLVPGLISKKMWLISRAIPYHSWFMDHDILYKLSNRSIHKLPISLKKEKFPFPYKKGLWYFKRKNKWHTSLSRFFIRHFLLTIRKH